jgi:predicted metalloprotease with PDZ domain
MKSIIAILVLAAAASSAEARQEGAAERIRERMRTELDSELAKLRRELKALVAQELSKAGYGAVVPKEEKDFARELDRHAKMLADDALNARLKKFLLTPAAKPIIRDMLTQANVETVGEAMEMFFDKGEDGKLRVREEFSEQVEMFLDQVDPVRKPPPAPKTAFLGFKPEALTNGERLRLGLAAPRGVRAFEIVEGSPADKAGMEKDDVLLSIGGKELSIEKVDEVMNSLKPGEVVAVVFYRDRAKHTIQVTLGSR